MGRKIKLATCCYCGSKATLTFAKKDRGQRELVCRSCGAPLRRLKALRVEPQKAPDTPRRKPSRPIEARPAERRDRPRRRKRGEKRRPSPLMRFLREVVDELEDLFD